MTNLYAENKKYILRKLIDHDLHLNNQKEIVNNLILVNISNVNYWVRNNSIKGDNDVTEILENIENLPWPIVWFEYKTASIQDGEVLNGSVLERKYSDLTCGVLTIEDKKEINLLFFTSDGSDIKCVGRFTYYKSIFKDFDMYIDSDMRGLVPNKDLEYQLCANTIGMLIHPVLYSIIFCHCKNVEYKDKSHPEALQKRNKERGKTPQETYKVLDIEGLKKKIVAKSNGSNTDGNTALHVCRGHFREYTEDAPLFGHYTGKVWVPMHMRGKEENGKIKKDYKVNT